jgi:primosomal protein N' (replication factor Y)
MQTGDIVDEVLEIEFEPSAVARYVSVVVQAEGPFGEAPLTYSEIDGVSLAVGDAVLVPFGSSRDVIGYIVGINQPCDPELLSRIKPIRARIDGASAFDESLWTCARWVCEQTLSEPRDVIRLIAPTLQSASIKTLVRLSPEWPALTTGIRSEPQKQLLERLVNHATHCIELTELSKGVDSAQSAITALRKRKAIALERVVRPAANRTKIVRILGLAASVDEALAEAERMLVGHAKAQGALLKKLVDAVSAKSAVPVMGVSMQAGEASAAKSLVEKGFAKFVEIEVRRDPFGARSLSPPTRPPALTDEQAAAARAIGGAMETQAREPFLLYGVTGSGKTEVYLDAIARTRRMGRGALFLLPEIGLTAQVMDLLRGRFGDEVAVLHSALSEGERHDEWQRIVRGEATIVVGARSAIFAPVHNLGLIVVDEEHESSFKQDSLPRYHARDVARFRALQSKAVLVLGSATPSIESYYYAMRGMYRLLNLTKRVAERPLPPVIILDQRLSAKPLMGDDSAKNQALSILSEQLQNALEKRLKLHQQSILFINRRGFSSFLLCRDCGFSLKCPNCDVTLTYHRSAYLLQCHHCDYRVPAVDICPQCGGFRLRPFGLGTEKVEEAVRACFPDARTIRMDRDTTERKGAHADLLRSFRKFEADILIGTQMVAKGLDFPNVTLVGVISADTSLNIPDYRASERAFQLLTQVAGRAGRGESEGEVFVQTFDPEHESVQFAMKHDYVGFYNNEIEGRQSLHYPPFGYLANLVSTDQIESRAIERIRHVEQTLQQLIKAAGLLGAVELLGPVACPLSRLRNKYRQHLVVRSRKRKAMLLLLKDLLAELTITDRLSLSVDIDPISML